MRECRRIDRHLTHQSGRGGERDTDPFRDRRSPCAAPEVPLRVMLAEPGEACRFRHFLFAHREVSAKSRDQSLVRSFNQSLASRVFTKLFIRLSSLCLRSFKGLQIELYRIYHFGVLKLRIKVWYNCCISDDCGTPSMVLPCGNGQPFAGVF